MNNIFTKMYEYQFGGSLPLNSPTYVVRQADADLFRGVLAGEFCYVLNSRQMGKSSLRVRTIELLKNRGIVCGVVDLTAIFSRNITAEEWYAAFAYSVLSSFNLADKINLPKWWRDRLSFSPVERLRLLLTEVILHQIPHNVVIFVDEIDSVLGLKFPVYDFFGLIRSCYKKRQKYPEYQRLTWVLLGVASPSELSSNPNFSPFDMGREIQLTGFQLQDCLGLAEGLVMKARDPQKVLKSILDWTGGKPFLTQKMCHLVANSESFIALNQEQNRVNQLVHTKILQNWEAQDEPEHLRSIRDRLLESPNRKSLLELYSQILNQGEIPSEESPEQTELRLSGLVVKVPFGHYYARPVIGVYNKIYAHTFDLKWLKNRLGYSPEKSIYLSKNQYLSDEQKLYDHLLYWVQQESPSIMIQRVHKLFIEVIGYPDIEISAVLRRLIIQISESSQFNKILNRCFYILINHWQIRASSKIAIVGLIALFNNQSQYQYCHSSPLPKYVEKLKTMVDDFCKSHEYKMIEKLFVEPIIHATVKEFEESEDYHFLRILIENKSSAKSHSSSIFTSPLKTQIYRYPYLYRYSLVASNSSREHQQLLQEIQAERQWEFELSLSQYATYLIKKISGLNSQKPLANPTLLSDQDLYLAIKQFTGKVEGNSSYKDLARKFLEHTETVRSYQEFKEQFYNYIITAIDSDVHSQHFDFKLRHKLKSLLPEQDNKGFNSLLLNQTCDNLLKFLIESPDDPKHYIFVNLIANLGELKTSALLLKIVLISGQSQSNLGEQLFQWFNYYESKPIDQIQWFINFLENINIALVINNETLDVSSIQSYLK
ncbi:AAA-like domain-containing protein [Roseofilum sp. BLCC_M154]|uniref:AAA-like domain-containing protein n=1 Tax=Roseofilum acuticapitatum BLCC-M154 TaxID=3022444 RepID=A0ABT7AVZ7_9CYAN|nr:AAA-like domain-containing protein [Roseofilum acuticapitatum]MDJ1171084.1 AAA-like domain-containing protein [Roseofilum acuticapitatum BLCC-M154]